MYMVRDLERERERQRQRGGGRERGRDTCILNIYIYKYIWAIIPDHSRDLALLQVGFLEGLAEVFNKSWTYSRNIVDYTHKDRAPTRLLPLWRSCKQFKGGTTTVFI